MNDWGLTDKGFKRPLYTELLDALEIKAKELFGSNINLSSRSALGVLFRIFAWISGILWQLAEDVYNSGFVDTAAGISLVRLGAFIGIRPLNAQKATGQIIITGDPATEVLAGFIVSSHNNQWFVTVSDVTLPESGYASAPIQAYAAGPDGNVGAGAIADVVTPIAGVESVINEEATIGGRNQETEQQFRERYRASTDISGGSNTDAIRAELLKVEAITMAQVFENDTHETDGRGLPPNSIECLVLGGLDTEVADAIMRSKPAGIQAVGSSSVTLIDASGNPKDIHFSRPEAVPVWFKISELLTDSTYPVNGADLIREAIAAFANGLNPGEGVIFNRLRIPVFSVPGIVDFNIHTSRDGESWEQSNITVTARERIETGIDMVVIEL